MNYSRYLVPTKKQTNNQFYSFGGKRAITQARENEAFVTPALLSNTEHQVRTLSRRVNLCQQPDIQHVVDYTKNIS